MCAQIVIKRGRFESPIIPTKPLNEKSMFSYDWASHRLSRHFKRTTLVRFEPYFGIYLSYNVAW